MSYLKAYEKYAYSDYFKTELPIEWNEKRLNYISAYDKNSFVDGPFGSDLKSDDYKDSGVPLIQLNNIRDGKHILQNYKFITEKKRIELSRHVALPNDIVIAKMAEPVARSAIVSSQYPEYVIVADCVKLSPDLNLVNLNFLNWAINSELVKRNAELVSSGTTRIRVSLGELKKLKIPYPSLVEQSQIANFLDFETAQIDTLIEKQQTLIQLLKEKRQAVISHAVTKGLNPDALMKDSGVEWLGEVPEHWEIMPLKYAVTFQRGHDLPAQNRTAGNVPLVTSAGISSTHNIAIAKAPGLVTGRYGTIGKFNLLEEDYWPLNTTLYSINLRGNNPKYLWYMLHNLTPIFLANSLKSAVPGVDRNDLHVVKVAITKDRDEQKVLCNYLEKTHQKYDLITKKALNSLALLKERRTALISAAVTGKIDVRGWIAPN